MTRRFVIGSLALTVIGGLAAAILPQVCSSITPEAPRLIVLPSPGPPPDPDPMLPPPGAQRRSFNGDFYYLVPLG